MYIPKIHDIVVVALFKSKMARSGSSTFVSLQVTVACRVQVFKFAVQRLALAFDHHMLDGALGQHMVVEDDT